jgi:subtilisin family serine protease
MGQMPRSSRSLLALVAGLVTAVTTSATATPTVNDPVFQQGLQWGLTRIGAPEAWARSTGAGVTIAVVDSGADLAHQDLAGKIVGQVGCIGANGDPARCTGSAQDDNGHGTHVSGIAAATTDNGLGIAGVAPSAKLLAVRVLANDCSASGCTASGTSGDVAAGIRWAVDHGARIVNLSLGGGAVQSALGCSFCDAIDYAWSKGVIAVIAAGNDAVLPSGFADEPAVIVTATDRDDQRASYSSSSSDVVRAARWPVAAPGGEAETQASDCATGGHPRGILSTYWSTGRTNQYACLAGTSMAAPHVSGALALLLSLGYAPQAAIERLVATAKDLGPPGRDDSFGYGRIDVARAVGPASTAPPTTRGSGPTVTAGSSPSSAGGSPSSSVPGQPTTSAPAAPGSSAPVISTPDTSAAAPFGGPARRDKSPSAWLVAVAIAAILASGGGSAATAWRRLRAS